MPSLLSCKQLSVSAWLSKSHKLHLRQLEVTVRTMTPNKSFDTDTQVLPRFAQRLSCAGQVQR